MKVGDTITKAQLIQNESREYSVEFLIDTFKYETIKFHPRQTIDNLYIEWLEHSYIQEVCLDKNDNIIKITFIPNHNLNKTVPEYVEEFTWSFPYYDDTLIVVDDKT